MRRLLIKVASAAITQHRSCSHLTLRWRRLERFLCAVQIQTRPMRYQYALVVQSRPVGHFKAIVIARLVGRVKLEWRGLAELSMLDLS